MNESGGCDMVIIPSATYLARYNLLTLLRSGENYHHIMFRNPTAAVNLFPVGKQYLSFCKAKAAVTHNLIGRKIISNVIRSDTRNSLPTEAFVTED